MEKTEVATEVSVKNWDEFEKILHDLHLEKHSYRDFFYRGQPNSEWYLETTLERDYGQNFDLQKYYLSVLATYPVISTFTEKDWKCPAETKEVAKFLKNLKELDPRDLEFGETLPLYNFLVYLRHHGFPSPLLDWTLSPYIAVYFAFDKVDKKTKNVSVFVYLQRPESGNTSDPANPNIFLLGPYIKTHKRHFLQQSCYTTCIQINGNLPTFASHEDAFKNSQVNNFNSTSQYDNLWKIKIPASERSNFLSKLNTMNINAFSLFQSEDGLVKYLGNKAFLFK